MLLPLHLNLAPAGVTIGIPSRMIHRFVMPASVLTIRVIRPASSPSMVALTAASELAARNIAAASILDDDSINPAGDLTGTKIECGE